MRATQQLEEGGEEGTRLGLTHARQVINEHQCEVDVEGEGLCRAGCT